jgi:hypothetical protein
MPTTTNYGWTYPDSSGSTQLWTHFQTLATAIDTSLKTVNNSVPYTASAELSSTTASYTFSAIPRTLKRLRLHITARGDTASVYTNPYLRLGGDSGANYGWAYTYGINGTPNSNGAPLAGSTQTFINCGYMPAASSQAGRFGSLTIDILNWTQVNRTVVDVNFQGGFIAGGSFVVAQGCGEYFGAATLNQLTVYPAVGNFVSGTQLTLTGQS